MSAQTHEIPKIKVESRSELGSRPTRRLRGSGRLPLVIYGHGQEPFHVSADYREITDALKTGSHVIEVNCDGQTEPCLVKDLQWNYLGNKLIHIDLARVNLSEKVTLAIGLKFKGDAPGLKEAGAILEHPVSELTIACRADGIPDVLELDVSGMNVGDMIHAGQVPMPEGVELVDDPELLVASLHVLAQKEEPEEEAAGDAAEPEVIGKSEDKEEEAE